VAARKCRTDAWRHVARYMVAARRCSVVDLGCLMKTLGCSGVMAGAWSNVAVEGHMVEVLR